MDKLTMLWTGVCNLKIRICPQNSNSRIHRIGGAIFYTIFSFLLFNPVFLPDRIRGEEVATKEVSIPAISPMESVQILEKSIDPAEYLLGTGDELSIDIWGEINVHHSLTVTPEGYLDPRGWRNPSGREVSNRCQEYYPRSGS